jgi:hypothetical protein
MATNFTLTLDTTGPGGVTASIDGGAAYTADRDVDVVIDSSDSDLTGYQVKIWGDVDGSHNANIQPLEANSAWINLVEAGHTVRLSTGDAVKTVTVRLRDDVLNESSTAQDTITLDTSAPVPNITVSPDRTRVSKIATRNVSTFSWAADLEFEEYKIKVVGAAGDPHTAGTTIGTANGSTNMTGNAGNYPASTNIQSSINATDLENASAGDGPKVIKVFVREESGNWSV